jgi:hypothetical protein
LKRPGAISILVILFYTQLGYFGQFIIQQWMLKEEARGAWIAALPDRCFFRVQLAAVDAAGRWTEAGRECWYNNHLYDVIRRKTEEGSVWLYCMDDEREANLIRKSGELTHDNQGNPDKQTNHSLSPRIGDWLAEMTSLRLDRPLAPVDRHYGDRPRTLSVGWKETFVPPPKM